jgi:glycosyltransferase involved in cell wall biosynthesis
VNEPLVTACIITYNQRKFIDKCIEGALSQKANFEIDVIVNDDNSTDGTSDIVESYRSKSNGRLTYFKNECNLGMIGNWKASIKRCKTKYIALCEGDDYWCNDDKLKMQIEFLEKNSEYSICCHNVYELADNDEALTLKEQPSANISNTIVDLAKGNFISTPSVVFRNNLIEEFPDWFDDSPVADYVLHMLNAKNGKIQSLSTPMAVYRRHNLGVWSTQDNHKVVERWLKVLTYLLKENWDDDVLLELKNQKRDIVNQYLHGYLNYDLKVFLEKLRLFISEDSTIAEDWLFHYYPDHINHIKASNTFKLVKKLNDFRIKLLNKNKMS